MMKKFQIAVIGSAGPEEYEFEKPDKKMYEAAEKLGEQLAAQGCVTICGGKGGIMLGVARGPQNAGGITAAETAGIGRFTSSDFIDVEIVTGDLSMRGASQLIGMSDAIIALGGGAGTLQEICVAYRLQKPVVLLTGYGGWTDRLAGLDWLDERRLVEFAHVKTPQAATVKALSLIQSKKGQE
jgi:uncharacterized protein (TIGR00725 family)